MTPPEVRALPLPEFSAFARFMNDYLRKQNDALRKTVG